MSENNTTAMSYFRFKETDAKTRCFTDAGSEDLFEDRKRQACLAIRTRDNQEYIRTSALVILDAFIRDFMNRKQLYTSIPH